MDVNELKDKLIEAGCNSADLDDMVYDACHDKASNINNQGMTAQLKFILEQEWMDADSILSWFRS